LALSFIRTYKRARSEVKFYGMLAKNLLKSEFSFSYKNLRKKKNNLRFAAVNLRHISFGGRKTKTSVVAFKKLDKLAFYENGKFISLFIRT
jgi:hypothetical protein